MTFPVDSTRCAAINVSVPDPQPKSKTVSPVGSSANKDTLETPAKASHATQGKQFWEIANALRVLQILQSNLTIRDAGRNLQKHQRENQSTHSASLGSL